MIWLASIPSPGDDALRFGPLQLQAHKSSTAPPPERLIDITLASLRPPL
jgi:hypothetical protein